VDAYLIETRSIGGLSGSPVFVNLGFHRLIDGKLAQNKNPHRTLYILGLMHGHFALPGLKDLFPDDPLGRERLNMGIGIVTPAEKIREVLNQPFVMQKEKEGLEKLRSEQGGPVMDSLESEDALAFTKEDFEAALKKVSKKLPKVES